MNRAFVKEDDNAPEHLPERLHSDLPNYITPSGLEALKKQVDELETAVADFKQDESLASRQKQTHAERDLRYLRERVNRAIPVEVPVSPQQVKFGVTVELEDADRCIHRFTLVGEDETEISVGKVSWASPVGKMLSGHEPGDEVIWNRAGERIVLEVISLSGA
ncbi:MAG: transcription elongation factor GreAB [Sulfitobacter sp.]|nr:transcription elongation factor GreAB [Sulfitobacter sp.]